MCIPHDMGCQLVAFAGMPSSKEAGCATLLPHSPLTWADSDDVLPGCIFGYNYTLLIIEINILLEHPLQLLC